MAYIKEEEIAAIRQSADIVDIISAYIPVTQKGKNFVAVCPFHDDHTPSLTISRERQIFNCFTCRTGGNVFSFIMKYENVGFLEAVKIVAEKTGYHININNFSDNFNNKYKKEYSIMDISNKYFINNMNTELGIEARKYLANRGIDENIIKEFNIGLSLNEKDNLNKILQSKGYTVQDLDELGLVNKYGLEIYDSFTNRIMIPIENLQGQVVGFTGRIFHDEDAAKYLNTKETNIFKKSHILFNYHNARNAIREKKAVIVVEGNMDAIKVSSSGIKNVVALMGVALSTEQINTLKKLNVPVILMLDNDAAGLDATVKLGELLLNNNVDVQVVRLSGAKDPDEYIRKFGKEAFSDTINHALKYIDFKLEYLKNNKNLNNIEDLIEYVKEVIFSLKSTDDLTKELVLSKISKDYEVDINILKKALGNNLEKNERKVESPSNIIKKSKYEVVVNKVLFNMMDNSDYILIYKNKLGYFKEKIERMIASEIVYYNNEHHGINIADFTSSIMDNNEIYPRVMEIISANSNTVCDKNEFNNLIDILLDEYKKDEIKDLKEKIKKEMDVNKKVELIERLTEIKKGSVEQ